MTEAGAGTRRKAARRYHRSRSSQTLKLQVHQGLPMAGGLTRMWAAGDRRLRPDLQEQVGWGHRQLRLPLWRVRQ